MDYKEKITLLSKHNDKAIFNFNDFGPTFGGGKKCNWFSMADIISNDSVDEYDLAIGDNCQATENSCAYFPKSYYFN